MDQWIDGYNLLISQRLFTQVVFSKKIDYGYQPLQAQPVATYDSVFFNFPVQTLQMPNDNDRQENFMQLVDPFLAIPADRFISTDPSVERSKTAICDSNEIYEDLANNKVQKISGKKMSGFK